MGFGTSPPVITLTATPGTPTAMLLDCPLGGARGVATLRHSFDNGATWSSAQVTAASMTFGGFSATVANTTFTTDNTWNTTVATWANQGGTGDPTMATAANQPLYVYDASFACPVVKGLMSAATRLISASGGITGDSAFTLYSVGRFVTTSALAAHAAIGNSSTALQGSYVGYTAADLAVYGTGATATPTGAALSTGTIYRHGKVHASAAGADQGYLNGAVDGSASAGRTYALTAGFVLLARNSGTALTNSSLRYVVAMNAAIGAPDLALLDAYYDGLY